MALSLSTDCKCGNTARYINERGEACCAICPLREGLDSVRLVDVGHLLRAVRRMLDIDSRPDDPVPPEMAGTEATVAAEGMIQLISKLEHLDAVFALIKDIIGTKPSGDAKLWPENQQQQQKLLTSTTGSESSKEDSPGSSATDAEESLHQSDES